MDHHRNISLELIHREIDGEMYIEEFRPVVGYEGVYEISNFGRLKKVGCFLKSGKWRPEKIITASSSKKKKYLKVNLTYKGRITSTSIHRLVGFSFIPTVDGKDHINHKDCVHTNNFYKNLEWCTPQENNEHGVQMGVLKRGRKGYIRKGRSHIPKRYKKIVNILTKEEYESSEQVAKLMGYNHQYFGKQLRGDRINKTPFRYVGKEDFIKKPSKPRVVPKFNIGVFDMGGNLICTYSYKSDAATHVKCEVTDINDFLKGRRSHVKGFKFKPISETGEFIEASPFISKKKPAKPKKPKGLPTLPKPVIKLDLNGNELERFSSIGEAATKSNCGKSYMKKKLNGKAKGRLGYYKGFIYRYANQPQNW